MRLLPASVLILTSCIAPASQAGQPFQNKISPIIRQAKLPAGSYGIEMRALDGRLLFSDGGDRPLNPASSIKVLTAAAALSTLGPDFRFYTRVFRSGKDICLKGGGDPFLVTETMWLLVEEARRAGVLAIEGNLIADETLFPAAKNAATAFPGDGDRAFTAPFGALSLNFNSLTISADPAGLGKSPSIFLDPDLSSFRLKNSARTVASAGPRDVGASIDEKNGVLEVDLFGNVDHGGGRVTFYRAIPSPALYAGEMFKEHFIRAGGKFKGSVRVGSCPANAEEILKFASKPLSEIVFGMNKFSNNFIAEMLLRAFGSEPTAASGLSALKDWLSGAKISAPEIVLENASGLSRQTRVSPRTLVEVMRKAAGDFRIGSEFMASLGVAGVDGTLRRRLKGADTTGSVRAKSGRLSGVVSLTGFADNEEFGTVAFSMIFNLSVNQELTAQALEDRILESIVARRNR